MTESKTKHEEFYVMGLQIRTTNAQEMTSAGKISGLWGRFYAEQFAAKIPGNIEDGIYGVYHDYESDMNGEYSVTVGLKVKKGSMIPPGLTMVHIPAQDYMKFTTDIGEMPAIVIDGWRHIWNQVNQSKLKRKYSADFELYDHRCMDPKNAQVDILICI